MKYFAEVVVDLDVIAEPMIADPDVTLMSLNDIHTIQLDHFLSMVVIKVDLGFIGSCIHKGDMKILAQMLKNIDEKHGRVQSTASCCSYVQYC
jgi:aconitate hydratase 2/2-methylisocitrate dehydratase